MRIESRNEVAKDGTNSTKDNKTEMRKEKKKKRVLKYNVSPGIYQALIPPKVNHSIKLRINTNEFG